MRSVVVVLPASMWAMMPIFLHRSNGTVLDTAFVFFSSLRTSCSPTVFAGVLKFQPICGGRPPSITQLPQLPPIMRESLIGFRHAVYIFFLLDRCPTAISRIEQLVSQLVDHPLLSTSSGVRDQPANRQRCAPIGIHFHRHLIVRATHAPGL